jgi:hypothetical protein
MLSSVQKFPEERILLIQTNRAACILVVWAHHVLGLSVLVRLHGDQNQKDTRFGPSPEQVIVDVKEHIDPQKATDEPIRRPPSAILLSTDGSTLFSLTEEPDGEHIDGTFRGQAKGYARRILEQEISDQANRDVLIQDVMSIVIAFAVVFSRRLQIAKPKATSGVFVDDWTPQPAFIDHSQSTPDTDDVSVESQPTGASMQYHLPIERLHNSAKFLFGERKVVNNTVNDYVMIFTGVPLHEIPEPPGPTASILRSWNTLDSLWSNIRFLAISLSVIVFAFAHVSDLSTCFEVPLYENLAVLRATGLFMCLASWDGKSLLDICSDDCFEIIGSLMLGESSDVDLRLACLVSTRGWSIFLSTISDADPVHIGESDSHIRTASWHFDWAGSFWAPAD